MKKAEIIKFLQEIHLSLQNECYGKGFVSSPVIMKYVDKIEYFKLKLDDESIEVESLVANGIQFCGSCGQKVSLRRKRIDKAMISALIKAFEYVIHNGQQTFLIKNVRLNPVEYGVLNHLVRFGLLYKQEGFEHGEYGVPRRTVSKFMNGEWNVAEYYETDPTKQEGEEGRRTMSEKRISINEIPNISDLREEFGVKLVQYVWNEEFE